MNREKDICRVLTAVNDGGETSDQIEAMTGIPRGSVSAYLTELSRENLIRKTRSRRRIHNRGQPMFVYAPLRGES